MRSAYVVNKRAPWRVRAPAAHARARPRDLRPQLQARLRTPACCGVYLVASRV